MPGFLSTILAFIVAIGVLVTVHEFGHFWVARRLGVRVLRFSVGFGRPLWRRVAADGTEYMLAAIPLGGYVKMLDEREGEVPAAELGRAFNRKPVASRIAIVAAGPIFNFLFAILAYWLIFVIGVTGLRPLVGQVLPESPAAHAGLHGGDEIRMVDGRSTPTWDAARTALLKGSLGEGGIALEVTGSDGAARHVELDLAGLPLDLEGGDLLPGLGIEPWRPSIPAVIGEVMPGEPAERAGLRAGDRILSVDGRPIPDWNVWVEYVRAHPGTLLEVTVERDGAPLALALEPAGVVEGKREVGRIGAAVDMSRAPDLERYQAVQDYPPLEALGVAAVRTWDMTSLTLRVLGRLFTGRASLESVSGPITIAQYAGETARIGVVPFLAFLAVVSISLGILNLLPVPILDGGHLLYYLIELVKGSPLSEGAQQLGQRLGIVLLLGLMALAFYNDFSRLLD
ncbi:MAG: sigma E protease regulator RseP [Gammaproteobacteria bacterium]|nr:sigma E protease regulator RseP [Gammaproteobacteria bacterium]